MKILADLENQLDELDGWGQLLIKDCVETDGDVVQHRVDELRYNVMIQRGDMQHFKCLNTHMYA